MNQAPASEKESTRRALLKKLATAGYIAPATLLLLSTKASAAS